jgi:hypothetical protein
VIIHQTRSNAVLTPTVVGWLRPHTGASSDAAACSRQAWSSGNSAAAPVVATAMPGATGEPGDARLASRVALANSPTAISFSNA